MAAENVAEPKEASHVEEADELLQIVAQAARDPTAAAHRVLPRFKQIVGTCLTYRFPRTHLFLRKAS